MMNNDLLFEQDFQKIFNTIKTDMPEAKKYKAKLRHAVAEAPGEDPDLWGWLLTHLSPELQGKEGNISYAEHAIYLALAIATIGPSDNMMHTFATAMAISGIKRQHLIAVETAVDMEGFRVSLRHIVKLLAAKGGSFNYGALAKDIYFWQINKTNVARKWEREYAQNERSSNEQ